MSAALDRSGRIAGTRRGRVAGWLVSGIAIAFLAFDATMKLLALPIVLRASAELGFDGADLARTLGVVLLACTLLYAAPRTAIVGAILLTGYLGGAVAAHVRVGSPLFSHVLFGVYVGAFVWIGLALRDPALRAMLGVRAAR